MADEKNGHLSGLTQLQKTAIVAGAFVIVAISLVVAALVMWNALQYTHFQEGDLRAVASLSDVGGTSLEKAILRAHAIDAVINIKVVANKQAMILVAFAGAFALATVGFALFLIGADGAFKLQQGAGAGKLMFAGTAPGLLCFLLAAWLLSTGITHRSEINLGTVTFPSYAGPAEPADSGRVCSTQGGNDCIDKSSYDQIAPPGEAKG